MPHNSNSIKKDVKHLSASKIKTYMQCGWKFEFKYIYFLEEEKKYYLTRGSIFHEIIAEFLKDRFKNKQYFVDLLYLKVDEAKKKGLPLSDARSSESKVISTIINAFDSYHSVITSKPEFRVLDYDDITKSIANVKPAIELEFKIPIVSLKTMQPITDKYEVIGFIDEVSYCDENNYSVRDHKLHSLKYSDFAVLTDLQLGIYAYAFKYLATLGYFPELITNVHSTLKKVNVGFNSHLIKSTGNQFEFINSTLDDKNIEAKMNIVTNFGDKMYGGVHSPNYGDHCNWMCGFSEICAKRSCGKNIQKDLDTAKQKYQQSKDNIVDTLNKEELI